MWRTTLVAAAAVVVAASPPACRAGLGSFQVNISDGRRLDGGNHTTHAERVAQRRREWKLRKKSKHAAAEHARAANATWKRNSRRRPSGDAGAPRSKTTATS